VSAAKLKNLIILILVLVNVFMLILVVPPQLAAVRQARLADEQLETLFSSAGVHLDLDILPETEPARYLSLLIPDETAQSDAVQTLLGEGTELSAQGPVQHFTAPAGSVILVNGRISASLQLPAEDPATFTLRCLQLLELTTDEIGVIDTADGQLFSARLYVDGMQVMDSTLTFLYKDGALTRIEGAFLPHTPTRAGNDRCISAREALVQFLGSRLETGWVGASVDGISPVWTLTRTTGSLGFTLRPAWKLSTDTGAYLVDGLSKTVTIAS